MITMTQESSGSTGQPLPEWTEDHEISRHTFDDFRLGGRTIPGTAERAAWAYGALLLGEIMRNRLVGQYSVSVGMHGDRWAVVLWGSNAGEQWRRSSDPGMGQEG
jgi:hypothetical protein